MGFIITDFQQKSGLLVEESELLSVPNLASNSVFAITSIRLNVKLKWKILYKLFPSHLGLFFFKISLSQITFNKYFF